jgi:hypothetical protein
MVKRVIVAVALTVGLSACIATKTDIEEINKVLKQQKEESDLQTAKLKEGAMGLIEKNTKAIAELNASVAEKFKKLEEETLPKYGEQLKTNKELMDKIQEDMNQIATITKQNQKLIKELQSQINPIAVIELVRDALDDYVMKNKSKSAKDDAPAKDEKKDAKIEKDEKDDKPAKDAKDKK